MCHEGPHIISKIAGLSGARVRPLYRGVQCPFDLVTTAVESDSNGRTDTYDPSIPDEVSDFWRSFERVVLFEDIEYGQWGLHLFDEAESQVATREYARSRPAEFAAGDLILGEFLGDSEILLIRTNIQSADYGSVLIVLPLYRRDEWDRPADSLATFLDTYIEAQGEKYWETNSMASS